MKNVYLNLYIDDMKITNIITNILSKFNCDMSNQDFKDNIIEIVNIIYDNLSEYDEDLICDFINNKITHVCENQIEYFYSIKDNTILSSGETMCDYMWFLKCIDL